ncbi:hypothetical protein RM96_33950 [Cupriavidus sp. IDO]|nr:hypothetical protein RM96_33950 [Cupriavidus sp. IDO]
MPRIACSPIAKYSQQHVMRLQEGPIARHGLGSFQPLLLTLLGLSMDTVGMHALVRLFCGYGRVTAEGVWPFLAAR